LVKVKRFGTPQSSYVFSQSSLTSIIEKLKTTNEDRIEIYTNPGFEEIFKKYGYYQKERYYTVIIDLTKTEEELWKNLDKKRRNGIRYATKNKVIVNVSKEGEYLEFYKILYETYKRNKWLGFPDLTSLQGENKILMLAKYGDKIIAGSLVRFEGEGATYSMNGSLPEFLRFKPNELLLWEIVKLCKERGFKELNLSGSTRFKREFGGKLTPIDCWVKDKRIWIRWKEKARSDWMFDFS